MFFPVYSWFFFFFLSKHRTSLWTWHLIVSIVQSMSTQHHFEIIPLPCIRVVFVSSPWRTKLHHVPCRQNGSSRKTKVLTISNCKTQRYISNIHRIIKAQMHLTHWGRVAHICVSKLTIIGSDNGLSPGRRQAIYLNQCWNIVNLNLRNKIQWNLKRNSYIFIQENAFRLRNGVHFISVSMWLYHIQLWCCGLIAYSHNITWTLDLRNHFEKL